MNENITYVGLDVHKERIAMARARQGEEACFVKEFESSPARVLLDSVGPFSRIGCWRGAR